MGCIQTKERESEGKEMTDPKIVIIKLMTELNDKVISYKRTMNENKRSITYLDMAWLAHGIMEDASHIQFKCSELAKKLEGAKERE